MESLKIRIKITDPWELGEFLNWQPLEGNVILISFDENGGDALIKLAKEFTYNSLSCEYLIASPRHQGDKMENLTKDKTIFCNLVRISKEEAMSDAPFDLTNWRGGIAFVGTLETA